MNKTDIYIYPYSLVHPEYGFYTWAGDWSQDSRKAMRWTHEGAYNKKLLIAEGDKCIVFNLTKRERA